MTQTTITPEDLLMLRYFWQEKGDLTRYVRWEALVPVLERERPEVIAAHRNLIEARRTLDAIIDALPTDASD